ncbi:lmo0954 family membrane protein [Solibacillus sp. FSL H8-0538]|uniref:lmo0954 family membrane protein n=1 Tax=Solibacillus sp. FSL H8-0538 TaxID=2921400 RepID=UPI0030FAED2D
MKKFLLFTIGAFAALIALVALLPVAGLIISGLLVAAGLHYYTKSTAVFSKVMSIVLALAGLMSALSNTPGFIGLVAIAILYFIYKNWNVKGDEVIVESEHENDPFTNFEKEWAKLSK